ncbi:MAG: tRNA (N6-threonylcarbamoyladenosine(37)-N6)-methyltransferase TrmO, partial [Clostridia bacterium]|nr:tRNA (N6-threonylcarbamoyladenosine(37)-N6)-methyltransferase TrmO [Clostridia bacterium]
IPRQSGLVQALLGRVVFEPAFRHPDAVRGLEDFSHIWLLWQFSEAVRDNWSPTVRPPLLGGNTRMGVFATRSPFRPNPIGLSCVKLEKIDFNCSDGPVLFVSGCDLMDGTPIYDIKPYLPYADSIPDAAGGFTQTLADRTLEVEFDSLLLDRIPADKRETLIQVLSGDPRPSYQNNPERVYGFVFAGFEVKFTVSDRKLTVTEVIPEK